MDDAVRHTVSHIVLHAVRYAVCHEVRQAAHHAVRHAPTDIKTLQESTLPNYDEEWEVLGRIGLVVTLISDTS